jgi:hypothetical protein
MRVIKSKIHIDELKKMAEEMFGDLVKAVIDVEKEIMVVNGELHSDEQELLIEEGSKPENLWGINIYPQVDNENWIEFDSVINLKPPFWKQNSGSRQS